MWRSIASNALTLMVVALFMFGGLLLWAQSEYSAQGPLEAAICLEVPRGSTMARVSESLADEGAVSSPLMFRLGADYTDRASDLKAGSYLVPEGASMTEITDIVTRGGASTCGTEVVYRIGVTRATVQVREIDPATGRFETMASFDPSEDAVPEAYTRVRAEGDTRYRVALAEGVTSWQVVQELGQLDVLDGAVEVPVEGSLAPDSYEIAPGDTREDLIDRMQRAQEVILAQAWSERAEGLPLESPEEALILASIIEKETATPEERGVVSSVFINRLNRGIRLQTDPTVIYGVTEGREPLGRGLRQSELRAETPWNTYVIDGLPPTPIANPGRASVQAALNPDDTEFVYFVAKTLDPSDGHNFSRTLDEHNRFVAEYRALERARDN